jgi:hypothetical protein
MRTKSVSAHSPNSLAVFLPQVFEELQGLQQWVYLSIVQVLHRELSTCMQGSTHNKLAMLRAEAQHLHASSSAAVQDIVMARDFARRKVC